MEIYVVKQGDTIDSISAAYGILPEKLADDNQITYPYRLAVGQALLILNQVTDLSGARSVKTNGYGYPFISRWVLENTLPYLTSLSVFSYGFTGEGYIIPPILDDTWMIEAAVTANALPVLTLTPLGPDGRFNNSLITSVVTNEENKSRLINELLFTMNSKGYKGIDIDFEYIRMEDRDYFTEFVRDVADVMRANGYITTVALAPKTSADQPGLLYQGKDYGALGEIADGVLLMTYEWGYKYGPPMAVAPINMVRRVLDYAVTEIPSGKISLGIPNYGYDWPLPYERNVTEARTIGNIEAVRIAIENGAEILFDELSASPYFYYVSADGINHVVWFEDVRSLSYKYELVDEYNLEGLGYWNIQQWYKAMWLLLENTYNIERII